MSTVCTSDIDVRPAEASMVIVHQVPPQLADRFVELQEEITVAAKQAPGYVKTQVYPPAATDSNQWVAVMTFADQDSLNRWYESSERIDRAAKISEEIGEFSVKKMPTGFGAWFARLDDDAASDQLPGWKMVMVVLLALYPTVMLTTAFVNPWLSGLGLAVTILLGNILSVSLLQWVLMPQLTNFMQRWLRTPFAQAPLLNIGGVLGITALLLGFTMLFRLITG
ncbi:hypothetical protein CA54_38840 [Symmachiella macrocystis]|uniref:Antibiotic biosynthesis monooxygenase n=1 Tax=Symmachiella macrocystis TaxID=2527985 RepID=A0A5C6B9K9_9PLAN|nr:hypothetical protein [Symmachiella macrocystis]TWU08648.1 hypothetical protein CA54_38840 [Symmachiella macrocystis]